jgi:hypothetical protein
MSFSLGIAKWVGETIDEIEQVNKAIILELFTSVILDTPVLEGRLRGNWLITSDDPASGTVEVTDPTGDKTVRRVKEFVRDLSVTQDFDVYLTNNLPYAYRIEYDGWSKVKAPEGMVRKNLIRVSENLRGVA